MTPVPRFAMYFSKIFAKVLTSTSLLARALADLRHAAARSLMLALALARAPGNMVVKKLDSRT